MPYRQLRARRSLLQFKDVPWEPEGRYCHRLCTAIAAFWFSTEHLWILLAPFWLSTDDNYRLLRGQKGINTVQRCSVENQNWSAIYRHRFYKATAPFLFSTEHLWTALTPLLALNWRYLLACPRVKTFIYIHFVHQFFIETWQGRNGRKSRQYQTRVSWE